MSFQNGHSKLGGRKAGTPNRSFNVRERLEQLDCDPLEECIRIAQDPSTSPELKAKIWLSIVEYTSPKLRSVSVPESAGPEPPKIEIVRVLYRAPNGVPVDEEPAPRLLEVTKAK